MAQTTTVLLLTQRAHPGASGTVFEYTGDRQQAASYTLANRRQQTLTWAISDTPQTWSGDITIQATLITDPQETDWFDVYSIDTNNKTGFYNIVGNFVWLRAVVTDWTNGTISQVTASY